MNSLREKKKMKSLHKTIKIRQRERRIVQVMKRLLNFKNGRKMSEEESMMHLTFSMQLES
jgi:uncharacterized protein YxjI